ncbi:MAG: histidinol phosphate phosphatase domain-containing protein [Candidatus Margulisiibacteriota bacterium]
MENLGKRIEFHSHSIFSDGALLPAGLVREAEIRDHMALTISDHVDASNIDETIKSLVRFEKETRGKSPVTFIVGAEISYVVPSQILTYAKKAKKLGAKIIIVHGESTSEEVYPGTNHEAVSAKDIVNILAHPGNIAEEDVILAAKNGIYLELSAKHGHKDGNKHVAKLALQYGAKMLVDTDAHDEKGLITQEQAFQIAKDAGLSDTDAVRTVRDNPIELLKKI